MTTADKIFWLFTAAIMTAMIVATVLWGPHI